MSILLSGDEPGGVRDVVGILGARKGITVPFTPCYQKHKLDFYQTLSPCGVLS